MGSIHYRGGERRGRPMPSMSWACWGILIRCYISLQHYLSPADLHDGGDETSIMDSLCWRQMEKEKGKLWRGKTPRKTVDIETEQWWIKTVDRLIWKSSTWSEQFVFYWDTDNPQLVNISTIHQLISPIAPIAITEVVFQVSTIIYLDVGNDSLWCSGWQCLGSHPDRDDS